MYKLSSSKESVEFSEKTRVDKVEVSVVLSKLALEHSMLIVSTVYYTVQIHKDFHLGIHDNQESTCCGSFVNNRINLLLNRYHE